MILNVEAAPRQSLGWEHPWIFVAADVSNSVLHVRLLNFDLLPDSPHSSLEAREVLEKAIAEGKAFAADGQCYRSKDSVH